MNSGTDVRESSAEKVRERDGVRETGMEARSATCPTTVTRVLHVSAAAVCSLLPLEKPDIPAMGRLVVTISKLPRKEFRAFLGKVTTVDGGKGSRGTRLCKVGLSKLRIELRY